LTASSIDRPAFPGSISLPYTLTAGHAAGTFLAALGQHVILGSRCPDCGRVIAPAQDFCAECGTETPDLVEVSTAGALDGFTRTSAGVLGLIRLDGADTPLVHRLLDVELGDLTIGARVSARWSAEPSGHMLDLEGFVLGDTDTPAFDGSKPFMLEGEPVAQQRYHLDLRYQHAYGPYYGTMFDELGTSRRIVGIKCPSCERVLVPPREYCDVCFVRTGEWVDVSDTGVIKAFSVIHLEFVGQVREPPYIYAEIVLDGASTRLIHMIGGVDADEAPARVKPGMRVRALWREDAEPSGTLEDIDCFELVDE
jgi:hypothetical protein